MRFAPFRTAVAGCLFLTLFISSATAQPRRNSKESFAVSPSVLLKIIRAEDERRWNNTLPVFLLDPNPNVRKRAALAMGRIGNAEAMPRLLEVLKTDPDNDVRQEIVFAIGEIETSDGAAALMEILDDTRAVAEVRARAVEALGKIGAALLNDATAAGSAPNKRVAEIRLAIVNALKFEAGRRSAPEGLSILLGLTAALRTKPDGAGPVIARFLSYLDPRIVADALNALARLRLKDGNGEARELLVKHSDPIVRGNAGRVLGATEDKQAFDALLDRALHDEDLRVRVSATRALGSLKDVRAVEPLVQRGNALSKSSSLAEVNRNELLEITATLGRLLPNSLNAHVLAFLRRMHQLTRGEALEVEVAFARIVPGIFQQDPYQREILRPNVTWRQLSRRAQALAAIKDVTIGAATSSAGDNALTEAQKEVRDMLHRSDSRQFAIPDMLQAYAATLASENACEVLREYLTSNDVIIRATAAEMLGHQSADQANARALADALKAELPRVEKGEMNDAALAILEALAKQKSKEANQAIKSALDSSDHLIRRKAVVLLKTNGVGDFPDRIGTVKTRNTDADYRRAITRIGKRATATVVTNKGSFVIEFLPENAPLTVDNFVQLAKKGYFNGQTIPRVVPNFVIQAGDPRGDTNGGPGYQIRCEINEVSYERGTVGMALSGKDTGGSQWFVTHSPQPHLDGGYTVFGHVIRGMEVVDNIARGDVIRRVVINER